MVWELAAIRSPENTVDRSAENESKQNMSGSTI